MKPFINMNMVRDSAIIQKEAIFANIIGPGPSMDAHPAFSFQDFKNLVDGAY